LGPYVRLKHAGITMPPREDCVIRGNDFRPKARAKLLAAVFIELRGSPAKPVFYSIYVANSEQKRRTPRRAQLFQCYASNMQAD
jgi:hypothetical protein